MRYRRNKTDGGCYFFTLVTDHRQSLLTLPDNIGRLRDAFKREQKSNPFSIDAIVILPDHVHFIIRLPENDSDYSGRISRIKRYFSIGCKGINVLTSTSKGSKRELPVWQRRFWEHLVRDDEDWRRHMDYIHYNPVKHGFVNYPWDWPYSSLEKCEKRGWYDRGWAVSLEIREMSIGE